MSQVELIKSTWPSAKVGIVHLGLGAFHRAHQAVYLERNLARHDGGEWAICSANLRSGRELVKVLSAQGNRYQVAEYCDRSNVVLREIRAVQEVLFAGDDDRERGLLLDRLADPIVRIVTLTVTEKGYCLNPANGQLRQENPLILADLATPREPRSVPGILLEGLRRRKEAGIQPFAVLSCDNMPDNGQRTRQAVLGLAQRLDSALAEWIGKAVAFPSSMVDRIVPAMDEASHLRLLDIGCDDAAAVACEAFSQWVIEDHFPAGRPDWEGEGVQMVDNIRPFEDMKLRLLNGSHSLLAYVGLLAGFETVNQAINDPGMAQLISRYMHDEAAPTLDMPDGVDVASYAQELITRFGNDALEHRLRQIAMDGTQKLPQRWLLGAGQLLEQGRSINCTALGVAAWIRFTELEGDLLDDPWRERLQSLPSGPSRVDATLGLAEVFMPSVAQTNEFRLAVASAYEVLTTQGVRAALAI
jgi:fructuronate reductase